MARKRDPLRPHEDGNDPRGKVYFEIPEVIVVEHPSTVGAAKVVQLMRDPDPVLDIAGALEGPVRTASCNFDSANSRPDGCPQTVRYACSQKPKISDINEYLTRNEINGYGTGAIVARRWAYSWRFMYHGQWGIIDACNWTSLSHMKWNPYRVKWFESGMEEAAWAEDLIVIHANLSDELLMSIVAEQGVDTTKAQEIIDRRNGGGVTC